MPDQPSTPDYEPEPPRGRSIPDDFIWDPETQAWYAPGEPCLMDTEAIRAYNEALWEQKREEYRRSEQARILSSEPDLPAAGPIDLIPSSRKSHRASAKREHLPLFQDDDDNAPTKYALSPSDPDGDEPSEEVS